MFCNQLVIAARYNHQDASILAALTESLPFLEITLVLVRVDHWISVMAGDSCRGSVPDAMFFD
jgi:hypothetical protein